MTDSGKEFTYSKFAGLDFYRRINTRLLDLAEIGKQRRIVDLGCGSGAVTRLMLDRLETARQTCIYAIDHSATAIREAVSNLSDRGGTAVKFIQGDVNTLHENVEDQVDAIVYCNSIHYIPDKASLLEKIKGSLAPGGTFAFNSSFFDGGQPEESLDFYRRWMMKSMRLLRKDYGLRPVKSDKVESRKHLTVDAYRELVEDAGMTVQQMDVMKVEVPLQAWIDISSFRDFIEGSLTGVPLREASDTLKKAVAETYHDMGIEHVDRNWLSVVAARP